MDEVRSNVSDVSELCTIVRAL